MHFLTDTSETIIALATAPGRGAIAVLRISGSDAVAATNRLWRGKDLSKQASHTAHLGYIHENGKDIDQVLATLFIAPRSYTGENVVELSCHGSPFIVQEIIRAFGAQGVRYAKPGEFTRRAFLNGKLDLAQAEAVSDLIMSDSELSHKAALNQMRGGFSAEIAVLREKLIHFASLIELELDFSEEDVEFADRSALRKLIAELLFVIEALIQSFALGNVIKNGVPTVIVGKPNAGKSTLLNALLNEERAIVSDIPGTTRDFIEDEVNIGGVSFRFIDTAGLRETQDTIEAIGVQRTYAKMQEASLIIFLFDVLETPYSQFEAELAKIKALGIPYLVVANKLDQLEGKLPKPFDQMKDLVGMSAKNKADIETLRRKLLETVQLEQFSTGNTIVTNVRHHENLQTTKQALLQTVEGLDANISGDLLAEHIRQALNALGEITGEITTDDLLGNIFSKFCIGK